MIEYRENRKEPYATGGPSYLRTWKKSKRRKDKMKVARGYRS